LKEVSYCHAEDTRLASEAWPHRPDLAGVPVMAPAPGHAYEDDQQYQE
jgi:hypothetical protein